MVRAECPTFDARLEQAIWMDGSVNSFGWHHDAAKAVVADEQSRRGPSQARVVDAGPARSRVQFGGNRPRVAGVGTKTVRGVPNCRWPHRRRNVGDRRALFYLARAFAPARVLEIGTHVGASTVHLAAALMVGTRYARLVTVDVEDVNDGLQAVWRRAGLAKSPKQMIEDLCGRIEARFVIGDSRHFFAANDEMFDFVFLDGDHSADTVYEEMVSALALINENGLIVLHDYFPGGRPLWSDGVVISGPFAAVEKLRASRFAINAIPLGSLPWPTKLNSHATSLAVIAK
jgi:predicted O-methyltransferase YrrM